MIAGGDPMDCDHPFRVHMMANITNIEALATPAEPSHRPRTPMMKFAKAETTRPVAMNFFMLQ
jgi:hypothetical protein